MTPTLTAFAAIQLASRLAFASLSRARRRSLGAGSPPEGAECRGSKSACADLDGTKAGRVSRLALSTFGTAGRS